MSNTTQSKQAGDLMTMGGPAASDTGQPRPANQEQSSPATKSKHKPSQSQKQKRKGNKNLQQAQNNQLVTGDQNEEANGEAFSGSSLFAASTARKKNDEIGRTLQIGNEQMQLGKNQGSSRKGRRSQKQNSQGNAFVHNQQINRKEFQVFYGLIATKDDLASPYNLPEKKSSSKHKKVGSIGIDFQEEVAKKCTVNINSYKINEPTIKNQGAMQPAKPSTFEEAKEWFGRLNLDERVNALTTTSPYLAQVLINMKVLLHRQGPTLFAQHITVSQAAHSSKASRATGSFGQNMLYGGYLASQYKYNFMYPQYKYSQSPLSLTSFHQQDVFSLGYPEAVLSDQSSTQPSQSATDFNFNDFFYQRLQCKSEIDLFEKSEPEKFKAQETLVSCLRFCDLLMYLDTITVSQKLIRDADFFFDVLSKVTKGRAFQVQCKFHNQQRPNSSSTYVCIETPSYFKADRFNSFAEWIAVVLEENLWANFNYWKARTGGASSTSGSVSVKRSSTESQSAKSDSQKINVQSLQNLFELKDIEEQFGFTAPSHKVHTLATSWINAPLQKKKVIIETLKGIVTDRPATKTSQSANDKGMPLQLRTMGSDQSQSSAGSPQAAQKRSVNFHLQNQRFDSQQQALSIEREEFEEIERISLSVHFAPGSGDSPPTSDKIINQLQSKKIKSHQKNRNVIKSSQSMHADAEDKSASTTDQAEESSQQLVRRNREEAAGLGINVTCQQLASSLMSSPRQRQMEQSLDIRQQTMDPDGHDELHMDSNYQYALQFILYLLQSTLDRIETGKDYMCRCFLKLIQQMHQDQVVCELLNNQDGDSTSNRRASNNQALSHTNYDLNQSAVHGGQSQLRCSKVAASDTASGLSSLSKAKNKKKKKSKALSAVMNKTDNNQAPISTSGEVIKQEHAEADTPRVISATNSPNTDLPQQHFQNIERKTKIEGSHGDDEVTEQIADQNQDKNKQEKQHKNQKDCAEATDVAGQQPSDASGAASDGPGASPKSANNAEEGGQSVHKTEEDLDKPLNSDKQILGHISPGGVGQALMAGSDEINLISNVSQSDKIIDKIRPIQKNQIELINQINNQSHSHLQNTRSNMNSEHRLQNDSLSVQQITVNTQHTISTTKSKASTHDQNQTNTLQQQNPIIKSEKQDDDDLKAITPIDRGSAADFGSKAQDQSTTQPKEKGTGKQSKKNKSKKHNQQKEETSGAQSMAASSTAGQPGGVAQKDTGKYAVYVNKAASSGGQKKEKKASGKQAADSQKQKAGSTAKHNEEEKTNPGPQDNPQHNADDEERSVEQSFEDFEVDDEYTQIDHEEEAVDAKTDGDGHKDAQNAQDSSVTDKTKATASKDTSTQPAATQQHRKDKINHEKDEQFSGESNPLNLEAQRCSDEYGQPTAASVLAEANLGADDRYHDEGDALGKDSSVRLLESRHQQVDDGNVIEDGSSGSEGIEETRSSPSSSGPSLTGQPNAKAGAGERGDSKAAIATKDDLGLNVTTGSGIAIGQQQSEIIKQKKARDRRPFQSFGMQSAQSDHAQFVDAIDAVDPAIDGDTPKAAPIMHTPQSSSSNNDNYQLTAQGAVPLKSTDEVEVGTVQVAEGMAEPIYAQSSSKDEAQNEDQSKKQHGNEHEMSKIIISQSTEYVSHMLEKFEVDKQAEQPKNAPVEQSYQAKPGPSGRPNNSDAGSASSVNLQKQQQSAGNEEYTVTAKTSAKKQKKKKKAKDQEQSVPKVQSDDQTATDTTQAPASSAEVASGSAPQLYGLDSQQVGSSQKTATDGDAPANTESDASALSASAPKSKQKKAKQGANNPQQKRGGARQSNATAQDPFQEAQKPSENALLDASEPAANVNKMDDQASGEWTPIEGQQQEQKPQNMHNKKQNKVRAERDSEIGRQREMEQLPPLSLAKIQSIPAMAQSLKKITKSVSMMAPSSHRNATQHVQEYDHLENQNPFEIASAMSSNRGEALQHGIGRGSVAESVSTSNAMGDEVQPAKPRRRRKKAKAGALDHQEAMNQFIKQQQSKKADQSTNRFSTSNTDYSQQKGGSKQAGNKTMGKKNTNRDSTHIKDAAVAGGQGGYGPGRDSKIGGPAQKKAQNYVHGQQSTPGQQNQQNQAQGQGAKVHNPHAFQGNNEPQQVLPLPVYAKKTQSQMSSAAQNTQRKKSTKDDSLQYGGPMDDTSSVTAQTGPREPLKRDKEKDMDLSGGQNQHGRRASMKQNYYVNYYQEKGSVDAGQSESTFASATQVLSYEPTQLQQYPNAQTGQFQKNKRKGPNKAGQQASGYTAHGGANKYGRSEGAPQMAMTEAEQRAATKKEIIEAFEIQNTLQSHPGSSSKKGRTTAAQNQGATLADQMSLHDKNQSLGGPAGSESIHGPPSDPRDGDERQQAESPEEQDEPGPRHPTWTNNSFREQSNAAAPGSADAATDSKVRGSPAAFKPQSNYKQQHNNSYHHQQQNALPHAILQQPPNLPQEHHPHHFYGQQQVQVQQTTSSEEQRSIEQYQQAGHSTSSFLQQSPRHQLPENTLPNDLYMANPYGGGDGKEREAIDASGDQARFSPSSGQQQPTRPANDLKSGRASCPQPANLHSSEKSKSQLLPGLAMPSSQAQGRSSMVHYPQHAHQQELQSPNAQAAPLHQNMGQQHHFSSSTMVMHGNPNDLMAYPARGEPYRHQSSQYGYPDQQQNPNNRGNLKKFKQKKHDQPPRASGGSNQHSFLNYQQDEQYPFGQVVDHIKKDSGGNNEDLSVQQQAYSYGGSAKRQSDVQFASMGMPYKSKDKSDAMSQGHQHHQLPANSYAQPYHQQPAPQPYPPSGAPSGYNQPAAGAQMFVPKQHQMMQQQMHPHQNHQRQQQMPGGAQDELLAKGQPPAQSEPRVDNFEYRVVSAQGIGSGLIDTAESGGLVLNPTEGNELIDGQQPKQAEMAGQPLQGVQQSRGHFQNANGQSTQQQMQGQSSSPQQNFMMTSSSFGQVGQVQGQIGQINQVNQYNINQYPNLNIGSISSNNFGPAAAGSPSPNGANGMQQMPPNFYMSMQGLTNQLTPNYNQGLGGLPQNFPANHPQAPSIPTNLLNTLQGFSANMGALQQQQAAPAQNLQQQQQYMSMMAAANSQGQLQQMSGVKYPHHFFDQNLPQTIEYKFYEKFDNDIYDEVNKIQHQLDYTKEERNYVLQKLQTFCKQVFMTDGPQSGISEREESVAASADGSRQTSEIDEGAVASLKFQPKHHSTPSPKKIGKMNNSKANQNKQRLAPRIKQFGSLVTGLALESSDMDMAVTNLYLPDRDKMIESLDVFASCLCKWELIQDLNAISTASIPVIKAIVDLNLLREKEMNQIENSNQDNQKLQENSQDFGQTQNNMSLEEHNRQLQNQENASYMSKQKKMEKRIPDHMAKLKIDITFDDNMNQAGEEEYDFSGLTNHGFTPPHYYLTKQGSSISYGGIIEQKTHLGIASCKLIKHYVENYKCLKEVSIVLKQFLAKMGLNSPYHGGLSSYSTVLLLVAYMNKWNLKMSPTLTPSRLLMGFLDYYSYYFNVSLFGIDVSNNGSFYEHGSPESNFVILDPLNENNNTTKNSFLTHAIIKSFRKAFNKLKSLLIQYQQQQNVNITDNLLDAILKDENDASSDVQTQTNSISIMPQPQSNSECAKDSAQRDGEPHSGKGIDEKRERTSSGGYDSNQSGSNKQTQETQTEERRIPNAQATALSSEAGAAADRQEQTSSSPPQQNNETQQK